ncbi:hypothetical protein GOBAR_DD02127 [Gossypium barbadense]|nr:hypothetical protein GOBAR_DD02127 [Gossypium barbadense]
MPTSSYFTILSNSCLVLLFQAFFISIAASSDRHTPENHIRTRAGAPFKVALFADLHFGENAWTDWGPKQDVNSIKVMSSVLDTETPVYLGDVVTANNIPIANASLYWDQAISPTRSRGIPWASVFGNHDDAPFEWPMEWFAASGIPQLVCPVLNSGISNYVLQVLSKEKPHTPLVYLYFLDSGGGTYPEVISTAQADWFKHISEEINPDSRILEKILEILTDFYVYIRVPELIFWHIPSKAYKKVAPKFRIHKPCVGSINKEKVAAQEAEMGIMKILVKRPSVKAVFVGHNHGLDWCCPYGQLWLCFARHTGYGGYGNWARGSRILEINERPFSISSWIRMEDGSVHSEVILS